MTIEKHISDVLGKIFETGRPLPGALLNDGLLAEGWHFTTLIAEYLYDTTGSEERSKRMDIFLATTPFNLFTSEELKLLVGKRESWEELGQHDLIKYLFVTALTSKGTNSDQVCVCGECEGAKQISNPGALVDYIKKIIGG